MKTIVLEALGINRFGGGRTSILTLLSHCFAQDGDTRYLVLLSAAEPALSLFPNVQQVLVPTANRFAARLDLQRMLPGLVRREGAALVHFTKNLGAFGLPCPYVVTVHDLTTLLFPHQSARADVLYWKWVEPQTVRRAARVATVSHDAAKDIERFYGVPRGDIEVVCWAPHERFTANKDPDRLADLRRRYDLPESFILFVGILARKKNLPTLLRALAELRSRLSAAPDLVIVGRRYPQSDDTESLPLMHRLDLESHVRFVGGVPDDDLPLFYHSAAVYVLPSFHEGFGIPVLEAMACGAPVIVAPGGALPEVAGDAALVLKDAADVRGLADGLERVLGDQNLRDSMICRGYARAAAFSWEKSAQQMLAVYREVQERRRN